MHSEASAKICWRHELDVMVLGNDSELHDAVEKQQRSLKWEIELFVRVLE